MLRSLSSPRRLATRSHAGTATIQESPAPAGTLRTSTLWIYARYICFKVSDSLPCSLRHPSRRPSLRRRNFAVFVPCLPPESPLPPSPPLFLHLVGPRCSPLLPRPVSRIYEGGMAEYGGNARAGVMARISALSTWHRGSQWKTGGILEFPFRGKEKKKKGEITGRDEVDFWNIEDEWK